MAQSPCGADPRDADGHAMANLAAEWASLAPTKEDDMPPPVRPNSELPSVTNPPPAKSFAMAWAPSPFLGRFGANRRIALIGMAYFAAAGILLAVYLLLGAPSFVPKIPLAVAPPLPSVWVGGPGETDDLMNAPSGVPAPSVDPSLRHKFVKHHRKLG